MSDAAELPEFTNASDLKGGGDWFKAGDFEGCLAIFHDFRAARTQDQWGNDYATGVILVLDAPDGMVHFDGETSAVRGNLMSRITGVKFAIGRIAQGEGKPGMQPPWILEDATAAEIEAARKTWVKVMEKDRNGYWQPISNPDEGPF